MHWSVFLFMVGMLLKIKTFWLVRQRSDDRQSIQNGGAVRRTADGSGAVGARLNTIMVPVLPFSCIGDIIDDAFNGDIGIISVLSVILR